MRHLITGVAGFIGGHLADALLAAGDEVAGVDDFSLGKPAHLGAARGSGRYRFVEADISETAAAIEAFKTLAGDRPPDVIWHLAASSDIAAGVADPTIDLVRTQQTTFAAIQAAKAIGAPAIAFASTSAVYGEADRRLSEDAGPLLPISSYGAAKLASEAWLSAAAESALERIWLLRFPNVIGPRVTHGAMHDFAKRLAGKPPALRVLGDGTQTKPYLHVAELIDAMRFIVARAADRRNVFNIGPEGEGTPVSFIAEAMVARMAPGTPIVYAGGDRGWVGDVPRFTTCVERLARLGWRPTLSSDAAVLRAAAEIAAEPVR
jgi:UDP-glucose 4-epimerase